MGEEEAGVVATWWTDGRDETRHVGQPAGVQEQVAAIGPMQSAGLDEREVGDERTHLGLVLDVTDEVGVARQARLHHRRALAAAVVHDQIDLVAPQGRGRLGEGGETALPYLLLILVVWKLGISYVLYMLQASSFGIYEYYGGTVQNGWIGLILTYIAWRMLLLPALTDFPLLGVALS